LTGSTSITISGVSEIFAKILQRPITFRVVSVNDYVEQHKQPHTTPPYSIGDEDFLRKWSTTFKALERGEAAVVDPLLQQILGRELVPLQETLTKLFQSDQSS
ncbi:unnamed protein product, partial [Adineta ricciae]